MVQKFSTSAQGSFTFRNFKWQLGQHWAMVSINRCIAFIHSLLTAIHSLRSSPSGSMTACLRFPLPSVASACFSSSYWCEPSGMFFFGLKVLDERLPLQRSKTWSWAFAYASRTVTFKKTKQCKGLCGSTCSSWASIHVRSLPVWLCTLSSWRKGIVGDISELDAEMILVMCSDGSRAKLSRLFSAWETCDCIICVM